MAEFQCLLVEPRDGYQVIRLNRPQALNALNTALMGELTAALDAAEADADVRCVILTGSEKADAAEAERCGLVSRAVPASELMSEAEAAAAKIASLSPVAVTVCKEMVETAFETTLSQGLRTERRLFQALFATEDQKEGMAAFLD